MADPHAQTPAAGARRGPQEQLVRRRVVCAVVVLVGAAVLGWSLRIEPGNSLFYPAALLLAAVWVVGAFASGPLRLGRTGNREGRRPVLVPVGIGLGLGAVFLLGGLVVRQVPWLAGPVRDVLGHADRGSAAVLLLVTVVNGIAEELFFRGALFAAIPRWQVALTTLGYTVATAATGNIMLSFAAAVLGVVVGLERRTTGGILAPVLTHCTWSVLMLYALPSVLGRG